MDDNGYVLSGFGFLLLIPVMILIPIAISLEVQSSNLPNTFVKSDTIFQAYKDIQADMSSKVNQFLSKPTNQNGNIGTYGVIYNYTDSSKFLGNISYLYDRTQLTDYQSTFSNTIDYLNFSHNVKNHLEIHNESGTIPLKNGMEIDYEYINQTFDKNNKILYNYAMNVTINMNIEIKKDNSGLNQNFVMVYPVPIAFQINSNTTIQNTAISNVNVFFSNLNTQLSNIQITD